MPLLIIAWIAVAILTLAGAGIIGLIVYLVLLLALIPALFGHSLIQGMGAAASEGGWLSELAFYGIFYVPLMALNWLGSLMMIAWASEGHQMFFPQDVYFPPSTDAWLNKAFTAVLSPMTHLAYGVFGVNPAIHTPTVYASMLISGEIECVALVGVVWVLMLYPLGVMIVRERNRKKKEVEAGDVATPGLS